MTMTTSDARPRSARAQFRILIVEDHMLFAESLELVFSVEGYDVRRIDVPDNASSPGTLLSSLVRLRPRIVLLDLDLGGFGDGVRLIAPLARVGVNVVVVTARQQPLDPAFARSLGIDCSQMNYICVKSAAHFRSGFEKIAGSIHNIDTQAILTHDLSQLHYHRRPRPMFPLDQ